MPRNTEPVSSFHEETIDDVPEFLDFGIPPPEDDEIKPVAIKYQPIDLAAEAQAEQTLTINKKAIPKFAFKPVVIKKISQKLNK